ncbi:MAG: hypothetical protein EOO28_17795 [Comamonadaceae bacterium]|nr:MAG: hypothetical protein EOO28_17795 [Comamonadaceae bacterium]
MIDHQRELHALRERMAAVTSHLSKSDQNHWAARLQELAMGLNAEPALVARAVLAMFEGPTSLDAGVTCGDWALDSISLTTNGIAMDRPNVSWQDVMDYPRQVREMYLAAMALWLSSNEHEPMHHGTTGSVTLSNYGFGNEIGVCDGKFYARYEFGGHQLAWREDDISQDEARWGMMGQKHFNHLVILILSRIQAAGVNPWPGSPNPLPVLDMDGH